MVEVAVGADFILDTDALHVDDLGAGELICVLNRALANLLISNSVVNCVLDGGIALRFHIEIISLVSVLVSL